MKRLAQLRQLACCRCHAPPPSQACHTCHRWLDEYKEMDKEQAKAWFIKKLHLVNQWLALKDGENGADF